MSTRIAMGVLAGLISAAMFAAMLTETPLALLAGYFASLPLFAIGLTRGFLMAGVGGLTGTVAIAALGGVVFAVPFLIGFAAPIVVLVRQALLARADGAGATEWYPAGRLVVVLAGLAVILFGGTLMVIGMAEDSVVAVLEEMVRATVAQIDPAIAGRLTTQSIALTAALVPGLAAASWMVMMVVNGTLAQTILARRQLNVRPGGDLAALTVPTWLAAVAAGGALVLWQASGPLGLVGGLVVFVVGVAYLFQGLAVVHTVSRSWTWRTAALVGFYGSLVFVYQIAVPAVVLLGLVEPWLGLRARMAPGVGREE